MNEELQTLWALNGLDERLVALHAALARYPRERRSAEDRVVAERTRLESLKKELAAYQVRRRQMEKDIETLLAEERKFQGQLPLVKKNEEYAALLHEIASAKKKGSDRETDLLMLMEEEEQRQAEKPALEKELATLEAKTVQRLTALEQEERQELEVVGGIEAERATLVARLTAATRSRYERIRASKDGRAVVPILKGACGACFRGQPPQVLQEARRGDRLLSCDGCGCLLIWPPDSAA